MLNYAKRLGDYLHVAIDADERIKKLKGSLRPVQPEHIRVAIMQNLKAVDEVSIFTTDKDLINIIKLYKPDIMVKGSDWRGGEIIGSEYCKEIIFYERDNDESTTKTIEDYVSRRQLLR
jgi:D-beta-D-heptose 7-phosphate kinase/D-beta-D-heptose 1-phosphate adenosyltransferase